MLGEFFLEIRFDELQLGFVDFGHGVVECAFFEIENRCRIDVVAVEAHLKVQVRSERTSRVASDTNSVASLQSVTDVYLPAGEVCI